ncbi:MAG: hypothetical protein WDN49_10260 [Acetobacteraceae bacterium]
MLQSAADPAGLVIAMGFSGHGFCLGPVTARSPPPWRRACRWTCRSPPFALARFDRWNAPAEPMALHG